MEHNWSCAHCLLSGSQVLTEANLKLVANH